MPTSTQLAAGLIGAIGCDFRTAQNQLIFVECATGKLSALNLFPPSTMTNGLGRQSQYDAEALMGFVLSP
jgi:hypothetical protein